MTVISPGSFFFFWRTVHHVRHTKKWFGEVPDTITKWLRHKDERMVRSSTAKYHSRVESSRHPQLLLWSGQVHHQLSRSISLAAAAYSMEKKKRPNRLIYARWLVKIESNGFFLIIIGKRNGYEGDSWSTQGLRSLLSQHIYPFYPTHKRNVDVLLFDRWLLTDLPYGACTRVLERVRCCSSTWTPNHSICHSGKDSIVVL